MTPDDLTGDEPDEPTDDHAGRPGAAARRLVALRLVNRRRREHGEHTEATSLVAAPGDRDHEGDTAPETDAPPTADREVVKAAPPPGLPPGRAVDLPGRGTTWIHDSADGGTDGGPDGDERRDQPPLLLLHGWTATGGLNWFTSIPALSPTHRVITIDHRGHGRGIHTWRRFRLEDCADDVVALADELGIERFVPVGYSMGGPIAQLTWQRHPDRVAGLVLCATSRNFRGRPGERALFSVMTGLSVAARVTPGTLHRQMNERVIAGRFDNTPQGRWALDEMRRHDPRMLVEAGQAIGRFSSHEWIGGVDVPTAVVVTRYDAVVPSHRQRRLAASIAGATVHEVPGDHTVCATRPERFVPGLVDAVGSVTARIGRRVLEAS